MDVTKCKRRVAVVKSKLREAKKRLLVVERDGSDARIALCEKHIKGWEEKLQVAKSNLKIAKSVAKEIADDSVEEPSTLRKVLTYTGLAVTVVALAGVGALICNNRQSDEGISDEAVDTV